MSATGFATNASMTNVGTTKFTYNGMTFICYPQPLADSSSLANFQEDYDSTTMSYYLKDLTEYTTHDDTRFTKVITTLRMLVRPGMASPMPHIGDKMCYGSTNYSVVKNVEVSLVDKNSDLYLLRFTIAEPSSTSGTSIATEKQAPKIKKTDEVPPWQKPAKLTFTGTPTEGRVIGMAYKSFIYDSNKGDVTEDQIREHTVKGDYSKMVPIANTAGDPFRSPPPFPSVGATIQVSRAFLNGKFTFSISDVLGTVNNGEILCSTQGLKMYFKTGTLCVSAMTITPEIYEEPKQWLPNTKHPFGKTYGDLFYGYSKTVSASVAVNHTQEAIVVRNPLRYLQVNVTFSYRASGFGIMLANQGYKAIGDSGELENIYDNSPTQMLTEKWLGENGKVAEKGEKIWIGFSMYKPTGAIKKLLEELFDEDETFEWAKEDEKKK